jgi:flagellar basal-body rod modification protein FlgD
MAIQNVNAHLSGVGLGQAPEPAKKDLGEEEFLTLLMTQLGNQDPMNPMESAKFMDQLSAMNTVEQLMAANERLENLMMGLSSLNNQSSVGLVGKTIVARGDTVSHSSEEVTEFKFEVGEPVAKASITVKDSEGQIVDVIDVGATETGIQSLDWDGTGPEGVLPDGDYTFEIHAQNEHGDPVETRTYITGVVEEIRFDNGYPMLVIGGDRVGLDAILRILSGPEGAPVLPVSEGEGDPGDGSVSVPSSPAVAPGAGAVAQAYSGDPLGIQ